MPSLFIRKLSQEEIEAINALKKETASQTMAKAVRRSIISYMRILADYKKTVADNVRLRREVAEMKRTLEKISSLASQQGMNHQKKACAKHAALEETN